ncbi:MAG: hypothetical protein WA958_11335 [Tunicatimonas sp.]
MKLSPIGIGYLNSNEIFSVFICEKDKIVIVKNSTIIVIFFIIYLYHLITLLSICFAHNNSINALGTFIFNIAVGGLFANLFSDYSKIQPSIIPNQASYLLAKVPTAILLRIKVS